MIKVFCTVALNHDSTQSQVNISFVSKKRNVFNPEINNQRLNLCIEGSIRNARRNYLWLL